MRTIAVVNQKGGCGKTTTTINLAAFLALERRRTLIVDMDPQGHAGLGLRTNGPPPARTMYDVFVEHAKGRATKLRDIIIPVHKSLDLAPADILLGAVPEELAGLPNRAGVLAEILEDVKDAYDYIVVDCPPQVGLLTFNAVNACGEAIVPVDPSFFSLHGLGKLLETLDLLARKTGHEIAVRALVTLYPGRSQFAREVIAEIRDHLAGRCFSTIIRYSVKLAEAASHGLPIVGYCHSCAGFKDYEALATEVLRMEVASANDRATEVVLEKDESLSPSAPVMTPGGVVFALEAPNASRVQLVGDFNGWMPDGNEMTLAGGVWTKALELAPGRYRYRYVVDGVWCSDPLNAEVELSPYGGYNSVIVVADNARGQAADAA
jgi:chromosome partitioning protein